MRNLCLRCRIYGCDMQSIPDTFIVEQVGEPWEYGAHVRIIGEATACTRCNHYGGSAICGGRRDGAPAFWRRVKLVPPNVHEHRPMWGFWLWTRTGWVVAGMGVSRLGALLHAWQRRALVRDYIARRAEGGPWGIDAESAARARGEVGA